MNSDQGDNENGDVVDPFEDSKNIHLEYTDSCKTVPDPYNTTSSITHDAIHTTLQKCDGMMEEVHANDITAPLDTNDRSNNTKLQFQDKEYICMDPSNKLNHSGLVDQQLNDNVPQDNATKEIADYDFSVSGNAYHSNPIPALGGDKFESKASTSITNIHGYSNHINTSSNMTPGAEVNRKVHFPSELKCETLQAPTCAIHSNTNVDTKQLSNRKRPYNNLRVTIPNNINHHSSMNTQEAKGSIEEKRIGRTRSSTMIAKFSPRPHEMLIKKNSKLAQSPLRRPDSLPDSDTDSLRSKDELIKIKERNQQVLDEIHIILPTVEESTLNNGYDYDSDTEFTDLHTCQSHWSDDTSETSPSVANVKNGVDKSELKKVFKNFEKKLEKFRRRVIYRNTKILLRSLASESNDMLKSKNLPVEEMKSMTRIQHSAYVLKCLEEAHVVLSKFRKQNQRLSINNSNIEAPLSAQIRTYVSVVLREADAYFSKIIDKSSVPPNLIIHVQSFKQLCQEYTTMVEILKAIFALVPLIGKNLPIQTLIIQIFSLAMIMERRCLRELARDGVSTSREYILPRMSFQRLLRPHNAKFYVDTEFYDLNIGETLRTKAKELFQLYKDLTAFLFLNWHWLGEEGSRFYFEVVLNFLVLLIWAEENEKTRCAGYDAQKSIHFAQLQSNEEMDKLEKSKKEMKSNSKYYFSAIGSHHLKPGINAASYFCPSASIKHTCSKFGGDILNHILKSSPLRTKKGKSSITKFIQCQCFRKHPLNPYSEFGIRICFSNIQSIQAAINEYMLTRESKRICISGLILIASCFLYNSSFSKRNNLKVTQIQNYEHIVWSVIKTFGNDAEVTYFGFMIINLLIEENIYIPTTVWKNMLTEHMKSNLLFVLNELLYNLSIDYSNPQNILTSIELFRFLLYITHKNHIARTYIRNLENQDIIQMRVETIIHRNRSLRFSKSNVLEILAVEFWNSIRKSIRVSMDTEGAIDDLVSEDEIVSCCSLM